MFLSWAFLKCLFGSPADLPQHGEPSPQSAGVFNEGRMINGLRKSQSVEWTPFDSKANFKRVQRIEGKECNEEVLGCKVLVEFVFECFFRVDWPQIRTRFIDIWLSAKLWHSGSPSICGQ